MPREDGTEERYYYRYECDRCGKIEDGTVSTSVLGFMPKGWLVFTFAEGGNELAELTFHTKRCASGYFRDIIKDAGQPAEPTPIRTDDAEEEASE